MGISGVVKCYYQGETVLTVLKGQINRKPVLYLSLFADAVHITFAGVWRSRPSTSRYNIESLQQGGPAYCTLTPLSDTFSTVAATGDSLSLYVNVHSFLNFNLPSRLLSVPCSV